MINVNHDGDSYCSFRSRDGDGKECKEITLHSPRKKETIEYGEVDVRSIQVRNLDELKW